MILWQGKFSQLFKHKIEGKENTLNLTQGRRCFGKKMFEIYKCNQVMTINRRMSLIYWDGKITVTDNTCVDNHWLHHR